MARYASHGAHAPCRGIAGWFPPAVVLLAWHALLVASAYLCASLMSQQNYFAALRSPACADHRRCAVAGLGYVTTNPRWKRIQHQESLSFDDNNNYINPRALRGVISI